MNPNADAALLALVRRHGRKGINEAAVWTMLRADIPDLTVADSSALIGRLVGDGRLYRHHRRTRTMLKAGAESAPALPEPPDLFGSDQI